jgi:hypothetical protein
MSQFKRIIFLLIFCFLFSSDFLWAVKIKFQKGHIIEGEVIEKEKEKFRIKIKSAHINKSEISNIKYSLAQESDSLFYFGIIYLWDGMKIKTWFKRLPDGRIQIRDNSYFPDNHIFSQEEINKIRELPLAEIQIEKNITLKGMVVKESKNILFLENLQPPTDQQEIFYNQIIIPEEKILNGKSAQEKDNLERRKIRFQNISLSGVYYGGGGGYYFSYGISPEWFFRLKHPSKKYYFPNLSIEIYYLNFNTDSVNIDQLNFSFGLEWTFLPFKSHKGNLRSGFLFNFGENNNWNGNFIFAYEYPINNSRKWGDVKLCITNRLLYISSSLVSLLKYGPGIGVRYSF